MPGIPREVAEHPLKIHPGSKPVKQCLLLVARFIKEVYHPEWLVNPVLLQKKSGKLRMCVDYTGLNKACPKDPFPLPRID